MENNKISRGQRGGKKVGFRELSTDETGSPKFPYKFKEL